MGLISTFNIITYLMTRRLVKYFEYFGKVHQEGEKGRRDRSKEDGFDGSGP